MASALDEETAEEDYWTELYSALHSVERPGSFATIGMLDIFGPPGLEHSALGSIGLPLVPQQAEELAKLCSQAPFGRREATVYDANVRNCLQLSPSDFNLAGPQWDAQIRHLADGVIKRGLGLPDNLKVMPELYKLLLYEPGCFFTPHRDTEKIDGMFATMVVVLPSAHSGGELIIRHAGKEVVFDSAKENLHSIHFSAFFADCEHEIRPVSGGYRLALIYNLIAQGTSQFLTPADNRVAVQHVLDAITTWGQDAEGPEKLVMPLQHQYCTKSLSFSSLKGSDIATIDTILQAASAASGPRFHAYLGMLKKEERGGGHCDYIEVYDSSLELMHIVAPGEEVLAFQQLPLGEDEMLPEDALEEHAWDKERIEEATGNSGATMERWYYHAALILWPHANHWKIACANNLETALKDALSLAYSIQAASNPTFEERKDLEQALKALCNAAPNLGTSQAKNLASLVITCGDVRMAQTLLNTLPIAAATQVMMNLGTRFGWRALEAAVTSVFERACTPSGLADCFKLLLEFAPASAKPIGCVAGTTALASETVGIQNGDPTQEAGSTAQNSVPGAQPVADGAGGDHAAGAENGPEGTDEEVERADLSLRIVPLLVAKICKGSAAVAARPSYYSADAPFRLKDVPTASAFIDVVARFGIDTWQAAAAALVTNEVRLSLTSAAGLLSALIGPGGVGAPGRASPEGIALARSLADALAAALLAETETPQPASEPSYNRYYGNCAAPHSTARAPGFVASVLQMFHNLAVEAPVLDSVVAHFLATPKLHDLESTLLPAVKHLAQWLGSSARLETPWFVGLWRGCVNALEASTRTRPAEPRSWALPAACGCTCGECQRLVQFCLHPARTALQLRATKPVKKHVQDSIKTYQLPVHIVPETFYGGVNVTLVVNKNGSNGAVDEQALKSLKAEKAKYERNLKALAELRALGGVVLQERSTNELVYTDHQGATAEQHVDKRPRIGQNPGDT